MQNQMPLTELEHITLNTPTDIESYQTKLQTAISEKDLASEQLKAFVDAIKLKKKRKTRKQNEEEQRLRDQLKLAMEKICEIEKTADGSELRGATKSLFENVVHKREVLEQMIPPGHSTDDRNTDGLNPTSHHIPMDVDIPDMNTPSRLNGGDGGDVGSSMELGDLKNDSGTAMMIDVVDEPKTSEPTSASIGGDTVVECPQVSTFNKPAEGDVGTAVMSECVNDTNANKHGEGDVGTTVMSDDINDANVNERVGPEVGAAMVLERPQVITLDNSGEGDVGSILITERRNDADLNNFAEGDIGTDLIMGHPSDTNVNERVGSEVGTEKVLECPQVIIRFNPGEGDVGTAFITKYRNDADANEHAGPEVDAAMGMEHRQVATLDKPAEGHLGTALATERVDDANVNEPPAADVGNYSVAAPTKDIDAAMGVQGPQGPVLHDMGVAPTQDIGAAMGVQGSQGAMLHDIGVAPTQDIGAAMGVQGSQGAILRDVGVGNPDIDEWAHRGLNGFDNPYEHLHEYNNAAGFPLGQGEDQDLQILDNFLRQTDPQWPSDVVQEQLSPRDNVLQIISRRDQIMKRALELEQKLSTASDPNEIAVLRQAIAQFGTLLNDTEWQLNVALGALTQLAPQDRGGALQPGDERTHMPATMEESAHAPDDHKVAEGAAQNAQNERVEALSTQISELQNTKKDLRKTLRISSNELIKSEDAAIRLRVQKTEDEINDIEKQLGRLRRSKKKLEAAAAAPPGTDESKIAAPAPRPSKRKKLQDPSSPAPADGAAAIDGSATDVVGSATPTQPTGKLSAPANRKPGPMQAPKTELNMEFEDEQQTGDVAYLKYNEAQKAAFEVRARLEVQKFMADNRYEISSTVCRTIRVVQTFLPETAYTSRALAIHVHLNMQGNYKCRYHEKTKNYNVYDGKTGAPYLVYGCPYQYIPGQASVPIPDWCMDCGCSIDEVLLDFYFWKTWTARSSHPNHTDKDEGMGSDYLMPRKRTFVVQAFMRQTFLTIDDIYAEDHDTIEYRKRILALQARRIVQRLNSYVPDNLPHFKYRLQGPGEVVAA